MATYAPIDIEALISVLAVLCLVLVLESKLKANALR